MAATIGRPESLTEAVELQELAVETSSSPFINRSTSSLRSKSSLIHRRPRANTLEDVNALQEVNILRNRLHRGSVRGTFSTENRLSRRIWRVINSIGRSRKDYSLFLFHRNSSFRKNVKKIAKSKVFQVLMGLLVLLHSAVLCIYRPDIDGDQVERNIAIYYVTMVVILLYMVEAGLNIIAYGLIQSKKAYLKNPAHVLDIVVIILGILYISIAVSNRRTLIGEIFGSFMAIKLIKLFTLSQSVRFILKALAKSFAPLFYLFILTFIVITFLALIGIQLFHGSLHGGCYASYVTSAGQSKTLLVSNFPCDNSNGSNGSMPRLGSHRCPFSSTCTDWEEGPHRGIISFDNMGTAYLTVFQVISLEGWITILYLYESAWGYAWVWLYFNVVMFFGSIFILNLWTGVLTSVFIRVSEREEEHGKSRQLKEKQRITEDLQNYNDWLKISAEIDAPSDTGSFIDRRHSLFLWTDPLDEDSDEGHGSEEESDREEVGGAVGTRRRARVWLHKCRKAVRKVVKHKGFLWLVLTLRAINLILLMSLHFPAQQQDVFETVIFSLNYVFTLLYVVEFLMGVFSLSRRRYLTYFKNPLHISETVLTGLSVLEMVVFVPVEDLREFHMSVILNAIWCLKLIMFVKLTRSWKGMKDILRTVFQLLPAVLSLMALVFTFLFVYTILGIRLFGSRLSNTEYVEPNFDDLYTSFLLVFQLMTSEDWNNLLFSSLDYWIDDRGMGVGGAFAIYFVSGVSFGSFILLVVFLAMSVDKLSEVRGLQSDSAQQQEKTEKRRNQRKQYLSELKKEPQVKRRTLRRALKYISDKDTVPAATPKPTKKSRQLTLKLRSGSSSRDSRSVSSPLSDTERKENVDSPPTKETVKLRNPLRLVKQRSEFFEQQKLRTLESTVDRQTSLEQTAKPRRLSTKMSLDSATLRHESESPGSVPYARTQSSPADSPFITEQVMTFSELRKLDPIEEIHRSSSQELDSERDQADTDPESTRYPLSLSAVDEHLTSALRRGGSLEEEELYTLSIDPKSTVRKSETAKKVKEKLQYLLKWMKDYIGTIQLDPEKELAKIPEHSSFFILAPDNRFRQFCYKVVCSKAFSTITYVAIFVSSLLLTLEVPIGVDAPTDNTDNFLFFLCNIQRVMIWFDCFLMCYFLVEMILKAISLGMLLHKGSYLRGFFNILDFFVFIANIIPIIVFLPTLSEPSSNPGVCLAYSYEPRLASYLTILRVLRVLRPLRAVRIGGLYLVVSGLMSSIKSMGSIFFMTMLVLIVFAVAGVHIFKGRFFFCNDPMKNVEESCSGQYFVYDYTFTGASEFPGLFCPHAEERQWLQKGLNFDNIGYAILTLFSMLTIEGWQNVMYSGINSANETGVGQVPGSQGNRYSAIYFILYMIVMALILVNLFTGFVIVTFQDVGVKSFRETKLDRNQRNCLYYALTVKPLRQYTPKFSLHRRFHEAMLPVVEHAISQWIIAIALIINCILLACVMYDNQGLNQIIYYINIGFTVLFAFEAIMKIIVLTPPTYFRSVSNLFDFLIVVASLLELIIQNSVMIDPRFQYSHIASSFRVLRLLTFVSNIRLILWTVVKSLEIFPWVGFLLMIVFFMYTVAGMQLFGDIRRAPIDEVTDTEITEYNNFANFPQALLVMIRMATGENWQDIMLSCVGDQRCEVMNRTSCGSVAAYFFFPSFYFISSILILNLLVAIVIDNFDYILRDRSELSAHQLGVFVKLWSHYDREARGSLPTRSVLDLMRQCDPPVGWGRLCPELQAYKKMIKMNMPVVNGEVTFNATLFALVRTSLNIQCAGCPECAKSCNVELKQKLRILFPAMDVEKIDQVLPMENDQTVGEEYAALLVQRIWRGYTLKRRRVLELFHGAGTKKVLKAGPRTVPDPGPALLHRDSSDFELDLPPAPPRKISETASVSTVGTGPRSPDIFTFAVDIEPNRRYSSGLEVAPWTLSDELSPPPMSTTTPTQGAAVSTPTSASRPPPQSTRQPSQGAELPLSAQDRRHFSKGFVFKEDPKRDSVADNVSELSFTSAYSTPQDWEKMETTV